ncbi:6402_t:CDS:1, partial [Gigaspora margarita]
VKDTETPSLVSVSTSKKEKQSLKLPSQDEQSRLKKTIEKIIEKKLTEKFGTITTPFLARS